MSTRSTKSTPKHAVTNLKKFVFQIVPTGNRARFCPCIVLTLKPVVDNVLKIKGLLISLFLLRGLNVACFFITIYRSKSETSKYANYDIAGIP